MCGTQEIQEVTEKSKKKKTFMKSKKYGFPYRMIDIWNFLKIEVLHARIIEEFKVRLKQLICRRLSVGRLRLAPGLSCKVLSNEQAVTVLLMQKDVVCGV